MTIRTKAMITVGAGIGLLMTIVMLLISRSYLTNMNELERDQFSLNIDRVTESINSSIKYLESKSADWAIWDDSYQFVQDGNKEFINSNFGSPVTFDSLKINFMSFVKNDGTVVFEKAYDLKDLTEIKVPDSMYRILDNQILESKLFASNVGYSGILILDEGPAIISVRPILNSLGEGEKKGTLIFGRFIDQQFINDLKAVTKQEKINFYDVNDPKLPEDEAEIVSELIKNGKVIKNASSVKNEGWGILEDIYGKPNIFYGIYGNRDLHQQAIKGVTVLGILLGGFTIFFTLAVWIILGRLVLNPLKKLADEINDIAKIKDFTSRLKITSNDEFGTLASDINTMLINLENLGFESETRARDLADKLALIAQNNKDLEAGKKAILNILDDEKQLQTELKLEKIGIEKKVIERTKELNDEKSKLTASIEALSKAFVMIDLNGNVILTNENLNQIFNAKNIKWTLDDIQGKFGKSFNFIEAYQKMLKRNTRVAYDDIELNSRYFQVRLNPVYGGLEGKRSVIGVLAIIGDVTEQKVLERSKDEFFSIASHELRTPLTAIRGNTSMILDYYKEQVKDPELKQMVTDTHDASVRLIGIVNDFLDLSRLEQKRMEYKKSEFKILDVVLSVINELKVNAEEKGVKLNTDVDKYIKVNADPDKVKQVLFNVVGNSLKFTDKGSVTISSSTENDLIKISVTDTGIGIPKENQTLLFRKFQQAGTSTITRDGAKGTGLGLYISKLIIEGMGGTIALESSIEGKGSVFTFTLPVAKL